ncbi:MAG: hypothetical protein IPN08_04790 [Bacteroidales bacterium]|nr:hypothetical protein [Bacteroidales bacterium]MBK9356699.1 hypothetical protein [Bacteroidales bacterium]
MKKAIGIILIGLSMIAMLTNHFLISDSFLSNILSYLTALIVIAGLILVIPFKLIPLIIFDNREYDANKTIESLVKKIRLRAVLFNNISVAIFFFTILVILIGFYLLVFPPVEKLNNEDSYLTSSLTIRIGASVLLIFLVQILFKVFKYLLRVAAFYNAKADGIEFNKLKPEIELEKLMELFTPDKYDISELQQSSVSDNLIEMIKARLTK